MAHTIIGATVEVDPSTALWARTLDAAHGVIPSLFIGGDPDREYLSGVGALEIAFFGLSRERDLETIERIMGALEALRQAVIDGRAIRQQLVAAGRGEAVAA